MNKEDKEEFYLYFYRTSLGNKHSGKVFFDNTEALFAKVKEGINCNDVSEIRVTDTWDYMVVHWKQDVGILFPEELKNIEEFKPKKPSERTLIIPIKRREIRMEDVLSREIIEHNNLLREKRGK